MEGFTPEFVGVAENLEVLGEGRGVVARGAVLGGGAKLNEERRRGEREGTPLVSL